MKTTYIYCILGLAIMTAMTSCFTPNNRGGSGSVTVPSLMVSLDKPDATQIQNDLIGHSLSEGIENGYYPSYWKWNIEQGEISDFRIVSVDKDNETDYELTVAMRLTAMSGKAFDTKAKVLYVSRGNAGWQLEYVQSLGMDIVKTGRYNSCITSEYDDWYGCTFVYNNCEIPIEVGGKRYAWVTAGRQECVRFSEVVSPHSKIDVYDLLSIDYCEVP